MKKNNPVLLSVICILLTAPSFAQKVYKDYWDGQLYLKLKDEITFTLPDYDAAHPVSYPEPVSSLIQRFGIYSIHKAFPLLKTVKLQHTYKILFHRVTQTDQLIKSLQQNGWIEFAEKVPVRKIELTPNDPLISNQYALTNINAFGAWGLETGSHNVKIAIVDDEVRLDHVDLTANRWVNPGEIPGNGIDDDGDGYIDDVNGYDVADDDPDPISPVSTNGFQTHGTHCAGIADAVGNNSTGIASIGFGLSLIGVKCNPDTITSSTVIYFAMEGVQYAIAAHADVVSMSWGGDGYSITEQNVFDAGWADGIIFVAAAGNDASDALFYPAAYNHIVSVGSTTGSDAISGFSNYGSWVSVMAPGSGIYSTLAGTTSSYGNLSGTSMACPMVAGLCGLIKSYDTLLTNAQIVNCLESSCDNIDAQNSNLIGLLGAGRINAFAALQCATPSALPVAQFSSFDQTNCNGLVSFTDHSAFSPTEWLWHFGDGDSSTFQNPTHQYQFSGSFTVTLKVTNANGTDTTSQTHFANISLPASPLAPSTAVCAGESASLNATGTDTLRWFSDPVGGTPVATGQVFHTTPLFSPATYYVENEVTTPLQYNAPYDSSVGGGSVFTLTNYHDLLFDCYVPCTLISVKVYAQGAGPRTITLIRDGVTLASATVNIPDGESRVTLNFNLPAGNALELGCETDVNLFRNNSGASFPYTLPGLLSITGTNAGTGFYYYFYDWEIQGPPCVSARTPVLVSVVPAPAASFGSDVLANQVTFSDSSLGAASWKWDFDDPASGANDSSDLQNPAHLFSAIGTYHVCLRVTAANACTDSFCDSIHITSLVGIPGVFDDGNIIIYPNPVSNVLSLHFSSVYSGMKFIIRLRDVLGKTVSEKVIDNVQAPGNYEWDVSVVSAGVYLLILQNNSCRMIRKIIRE